MSKKLTTKEFILKALKVHKGKYKYDKVNYIKTNQKVIITCPIHGDFELRPNDHLQGCGCPLCKGSRAKLTTTTFIIKAKEVHRNKYNYSKVKYVDAHTPIVIICPIHGEFKLTPTSHLSGYGCSKCSNKYKPTTEEWIRKAREIHGNKYDYSNVDYINNKSNVQINCPIHGLFWQNAKHHLSGCGCPKCSTSKGETFIREYLVNNNIKYIAQYHINIDKSINTSGKAFIDFYLPDLNVAIEYNGAQHYIPVEHFGGKLKFKQLQLRDWYIRDYCKENKIKLIEIHYGLSYDTVKLYLDYLFLNLNHEIITMIPIEFFYELLKHYK